MMNSTYQDLQLQLSGDSSNKITIEMLNSGQRIRIRLDQNKDQPGLLEKKCEAIELEILMRPV